MAVSITTQDLIPALDTNWAEVARENTRRANANDASLQVAVEVLESKVSVQKIKSGPTTYTPNADGLVTLPSGVVAPATTTTERDAIANPTIGQLIENISTGQTERYTASGWRAVASQWQALTTSQRDALPTAEKYAGRGIYNTTLARAQVWDGSGWADLTPIAARKAQGTYVGDGTTHRAFAVGFTPDLVIVSGPTALSGAGAYFGVLHRTETSGLLNSVGWDNNGNRGYGGVGGYLTATGFSVLSGSVAGLNVNNAAANYYWTALKIG